MDGIGCGVDVGGSGIKGARVDLASGAVIGERQRIATPHPATPGSVATAIAQLTEQLGWSGPIGCTFPGVVTAGVARTAANVDASWIGVDVAGAVGAAHGAAVSVVNDADAAGLAEATYGAARDVGGVVLVVTLGTGVGTALIHDGRLVPNLELGHIELDGADAEWSTSAAARKRDALGWREWSARLQRYFRALEDYLWPDLIVVGGGVSRRAEKFLPLLELRSPIVPASLENRAGIVGAAQVAAAWTATCAASTSPR
jgi:polyphosphate glucokinase